MNQDEVRTLFAFNAWANHRVLQACSALTPAEFTHPATSSFPTVCDTLRHIMGVEWLYLERLHGRYPTELLPSEKFESVAQFEARWEGIKKGLEDYVRSPDLGDLERIIEYRNIQGKHFRYPLGALLQHVVNHSTYHRGQVATQLRELGAKPLSTDLLRYYDALAGLPVD
ncbi:MAG TPA: DinB family protein [Candidatus Acidoferrales bacterium]|nr:DinB family protein [Candidatus Acidoferrales bacterium]